MVAEVPIGGTQKKDFLSIPSRRAYALAHVFIFRMADGRIQQIAAYWDNVSFFDRRGRQPAARAA